jgi:hypothetical protein
MAAIFTSPTLRTTTRTEDGFLLELSPGVIAWLRALLQPLQARSLSSIFIPWAS